MKFGFLTDRKSFDCSDFRVTTVPEFDNVIEGFYQSVRVSNGWFYGPEKELEKSSKEREKFKNRGPIISSPFFMLNSTHEITSPRYDDDRLRFLILGYGFLQGLYLIPDGYSYLGKTAYEPGKLNGLHLSKDDYINGMECINKFYISSDPEKQAQMFACIHWHLVGQTYDFAWDRFDAQYKVLDGLFKLSGLEAKYHASRPVELAKKYGVKLPLWAELDATGKASTLSKLRNEFVHEARYAGHPIGYSYPIENYSLEFASFNTKLISATLGVKAPYLSAEPDNRAYWIWNIIA